MVPMLVEIQKTAYHSAYLSLGYTSWTLPLIDGHLSQKRRYK